MKRVEVVLGIIVADQNVLICRRRAADAFGGLWEFPGGKREKNETVEQCLHRELAEELGITVRITAALNPLEFDYPDLHVRLIPLLCAADSGCPRPLASEELKWVPAGDLRNWKFPEANAPLIDQLLARLGADESKSRPPRPASSDAKTPSQPRRNAKK
jgi:mutator protein MutT